MPPSQFQWQDKCGLTWDVCVRETPIDVSWYASPGRIGGRYEAYVLTHTLDCQEWLPMARLIDVRINSRMENRGAGTMLVREVIEECKRRGHVGIEGDVSSVDSGHFDKLKYFYKRLGFSVVFYGPEHPDYSYNKVGKIEMKFANAECPLRNDI